MPLIRMKQSRKANLSAQSAVLDDADLLGCILKHAKLTPEALVDMTRVSKEWRAAVRVDAALLLSAAHQPRFLTKGTFCGLFALNYCQADAYPHRAARRGKGGFLFMYTESAIDAVLPTTGGLEGSRRRLAQRAAYQSSLERAFGPEWRELSRLRRVPLAGA